MQDKIKFGTTFAISDDMIKYSNGEAIDYAKRNAGGEMGIMAIKEKDDCWEVEKEEHLSRYTMRLYIFTAEELKVYLAEQRRKWEKERYYL